MRKPEHFELADGYARFAPQDRYSFAFTTEREALAWLLDPKAG